MERPFLELLAYPLLGNLEDGAELAGSAAMATELWHRLPEAILERIVLLMPARSICRFRAVCRGWRCLLSSGAFFRCKEGVAPSPPLVCSIEPAVRVRGGVTERADGPAPRHCVPLTRPKPYRWDLSLIPKEAVSETQQSPPPPEEDAPVVEPPAWCWSVNEKVDSLDGLLCVTPGGGGGRRGGLLRDMVVVNPATRTYRRLPPVPPKYLGRELRSGRVALDEPFGTTFTFTWHMQSQQLPFRRGGDWVVGVYSSQTNSWRICDGPLDTTDAATWAGTVDSEVCGTVLYRLVKCGGGRSSSCRCVIYGFDTGRFVKQGEAPTPQVAVPSVPPHRCYAETKWSLLEHCGSMYLIAQILLYPGQMMDGFEIRKLDVGGAGQAGHVPASASAQLKFERVGGNPAHLVRRLFPNPTRPYNLPLRAMSSVGNHICLVLGGDDDDSSGRGRRGLVAAGYEAELRHVIAFDVPRREWQLLYEECGDEDSLVPVGEGQGSMDRMSLPSYPFMVPNFHVFL